MGEHGPSGAPFAGSASPTEEETRADPRERLKWPLFLATVGMYITKHWCYL